MVQVVVVKVVKVVLKLLVVVQVVDLYLVVKQVIYSKVVILLEEALAVLLDGVAERAGLWPREVGPREACGGPGAGRAGSRGLSRRAGLQRGTAARFPRPPSGRPAGNG